MQLAGKAAVVELNLIVLFRLAIVPLIVLGNNDSKIKNIPWPTQAGAVYIEYTNLDGGLNGFRFFAHSNPVSIRTTYVREYADVRLQLSLMGGRLALLDQRWMGGTLSTPVTFPVSVRRHLLYFWRELPGGKIELGAYMDWKLVAHRIYTPLSPLKLWTASTRIGARDLIPVEPTFPAQHHVGGIIHRFILLHERKTP